MPHPSPHAAAAALSGAGAPRCGPGAVRGEEAGGDASGGGPLRPADGPLPRVRACLVAGPALGAVVVCRGRVPPRPGAVGREENGGDPAGIPPGSPRPRVNTTYIPHGKP